MDQTVNAEVQTAVSEQQEGTMKEGAIGYKGQGEWGKAAYLTKQVNKEMEHAL